MKEILVPMDIVDLIDRIAALEVEAKNASDRASAQRYDILERIIDRMLPSDGGLRALRTALCEAHADLKTLENELRGCESRSDFGAGFVGLSRSYMATLDQRDQIKSDIAAHLRQASITTVAPTSQEI